MFFVDFRRPYWCTKTVHQYGVSNDTNSTKVRETFRQITQKLWATETWDLNKLFINKHFITFHFLASSTGLLACEWQTFFLVVDSLPTRTRTTKRFPWRKTFVANHSLALKIRKLTRETFRKIVRGGHVYKSKLKGQRSLCTPPFFLRGTRLRRLIYSDCGTDWWNKHWEDSFWRD